MLNRVQPVQQKDDVHNNPSPKKHDLPIVRKHTDITRTFQETLELEMLKLESKHLRQHDIDALFKKYAK